MTRPEQVSPDDDAKALRDELSPEIEGALAHLEDVRRAILVHEIPKTLGRVETIAAQLRLALAQVRPSPLELVDIGEAAARVGLPRRRLASLSRSATWALRVGRRVLVDVVALEAAIRRGDFDARRRRMSEGCANAQQADLSGPRWGRVRAIHARSGAEPKRDQRERL